MSKSTIPKLQLQPEVIAGLKKLKILTKFRDNANKVGWKRHSMWYQIGRREETNESTKVSDSLLGAFEWDRSPEGYEYWHKIRHKEMGIG